MRLPARLPLGYTNPVVTGADANLTVDGVTLTSASNTVANLIPGVTFQLLAPSATESDSSLEQVQVVIGNDNAGVESTIAQMVSDYNSLISAVNTQEGLDSSGNAEPLFGSPTLSLLQQQLLGGLNLPNPNGTLTSVSSTANATLSGSLTDSGGQRRSPANCRRRPTRLRRGSQHHLHRQRRQYTGWPGQRHQPGQSRRHGQRGNQRRPIEADICLANGRFRRRIDRSLQHQRRHRHGARLHDSGMSSGIPVDIGTLAGIPSQSDALTGSITIQVGTGQTQTIAVPANSATSPSNNLAGLAGAINSANIGVNASVIQNNDGSYSLQLQSETLGSTGDMTVTSNILDTTNTTTRAQLHRTRRTSTA